MKKLRLIKFIRVIFFIPAMYLGVFVSIFVAIIFNSPFIFLESHFGNWPVNLIIGILGLENINIKVSEGIIVMFSGVFASLIGLLFALSVFPYGRHRSKVAYVLFAMLLIRPAPPRQIEIYGSYFVYFSKLVGLVLGFGIILSAILNEKSSRIFNFIDNKFGRHEEADKAHKKAIKLDPNDAPTFYNRGNAYADKKDYDTAIQDYTKAIKLNPNYADAMANMGLAYEGKGDKKSARIWWEKAIKRQEYLPDGGEEIVRQWIKELEE